MDSRALTIRNEQMMAFSAGLYQRHRDALVARVMEAEAARGSARSEVEIEALVDATLHRVHRGGLITPADFGALGDLMARFGPDVEAELPWAAYLLDHPEIPPGTKLSLIADKAFDQAPPGGGPP